MKKFIIVHNWEYNQSAYLFETNLQTEESILENIYSICEVLGIDFDEEKEESITVEEVTEIKTVIL